MNLKALVLAGFLLPAATLVVAAEEVQRQSAPLVIANRTVFTLRGPLAGYSADERAKISTRRIKVILESDPAPTVSLQEVEGATRILLGGKLAVLVSRIDVDEQAGETTTAVAQDVAKRIETSIEEWREQTSPRALMTAALLVAAATLVFGLILWLLFRASRWLGHRLSAAADEQARKLHVGSVRTIAQRFVAFLAWVLAIALTSIWLAFVLRRIPHTRVLGENLRESLIDLVVQGVLAFAGAAPGLLVVVIVFLLAKVFIGLARAFFDRAEAGQVQVRWLDADTVRPTRQIFTVGVWIFALAIAYPYLPGANTDAFKGLSVLVGVMLSLGGASIIGQAFSGLILMYARIFRRGDYVRIDEFEGTVSELGMFATRIRTGLGEEITLSNTKILSGSTKNYSRAVEGTGYVLDTAVTIGYATPWRQVHAMLEEAARRTEEIAPKPAAYVRQTALSDFYVEYRLVAYSLLERAAGRADVLSRLHANIQDVFNENNVQIMSPNYEADPEVPQVVPKEKWNTPLATR